MCSPSWNPLPPPTPSHLSGSSQCTSPEHLSHASNLDWWSVSQLIIYMFQCYSVRSSHPHLLPQSQQICSVYLHLFKTLFSQKKKKSFQYMTVQVICFLLKRRVWWLQKWTHCVNCPSYAVFNLWELPWEFSNHENLTVEGSQSDLILQV